MKGFGDTTGRKKLTSGSESINGGLELRLYFNIVKTMLGGDNN